MHGLLWLAIYFTVGIILRCLFLEVQTDQPFQIVVLAWTLIVLLPELLFGPISNRRLLSPIGNLTHYLQIRQRVARGDLPLGLIEWFAESKIPISPKPTPEPSRAFILSVKLVSFLILASIVALSSAAIGSRFGQPFSHSFMLLLSIQLPHQILIICVKSSNRLFAPACKKNEFEALLKWEGGEWVKTTKMYGGHLQHLTLDRNGLQAATPLEDIERLRRLREKARERAQESRQPE